MPPVLQTQANIIAEHLVLRESHCEVDVLLAAGSDKFVETDDAQYAAGEAPSQEAALEGDNRQRALHRLHGGVEAREPDGIEVDIGATHQSKECCRCQPWRDNQIAIRIETGGPKSCPQSRQQPGAQ